MMTARQNCISCKFKKQYQTVPKRTGKFRIDQNSKITQTAQLWASMQTFSVRISPPYVKEKFLTISI